MCLWPSQTPGGTLNLHRTKHLKLLLCKSPHVALAECRVLPQLGRALCNRLRDLGRGQFEIFRRPVVKLAAQCTHGVHSVATQPRQQFGNVLRGFGIVFKQAMAAFLDDFHG